MHSRPSRADGFVRHHRIRRRAAAMLGFATCCTPSRPDRWGPQTMTMISRLITRICCAFGDRSASAAACGVPTTAGRSASGQRRAEGDFSYGKAPRPSGPAQRQHRDRDVGHDRRNLCAIRRRSPRCSTMATMRVLPIIRRGSVRASLTSFSSRRRCRHHARRCSITSRRRASPATSEPIHLYHQTL